MPASDPQNYMRLYRETGNVLFAWCAVNLLLQPDPAGASAAPVVLPPDVAVFLRQTSESLVLLPMMHEADDALRHVTREMGLSKTPVNSFKAFMSAQQKMREAELYDNERARGKSARDSMAAVGAAFEHRSDRQHEKRIAEGRKLLGKTSNTAI